MNDETIEQENIYEEIYNLLEKEFSFKPSDTNSLSDLIYLNDDENIEEKIKMINYLLSLNREDIYNDIWNADDFWNDETVSKLNGEILELYNKREKLKEERDNTIFNISKPFIGENIKLQPMDDKYSKELIDSLNDADCNFYFSINHYNYENRFMFSIINDLNELVGEVSLDLIHNFGPINLFSTYNLSYYIVPKYRRKGYAYNACKLLIENAFNNQMILKEEQYDVIYTFKKKQLKLNKFS